MRNRVIISVASIIALVFLLAACGGGSAPKYSIVSKWQLTETNGIPADEMAKAMTFDFTADGKIRILMGELEAGAFTYTTGKAGSLESIIITMTENGKSESMYGCFSFADAGQTLILKTNNSGTAYPTNMDNEDGFTVEKYTRLP